MREKKGEKNLIKKHKKAQKRFGKYLYNIPITGFYQSKTKKKKKKKNERP